MIEDEYINPGHFTLGIISGALVSILINLSLEKDKGVATMYPQEQTEAYTGQEQRTWMVRELEEINPTMVYEEERQHWQTGSTPVEIVGHDSGELSRALTLMEDSINYGQKARVQLLTDTLPTRAELDTLYSAMVANGFHTTKPTAKVVGGIPSITMIIRKGSPAWSLLIPLIPIGIIGGLIAFGITRIETISRALLPLMLVTVGGIVVVIGMLSRKQVMETARSYVERAPTRRFLTQNIPNEPAPLKKAPAAS
jgi:hypothetical protein